MHQLYILLKYGGSATKHKLYDQIGAKSTNYCKIDIAMVTNIMAVTHIWNLFSIKHYWLHILVKFGTSIADMKYMKILQFWHSRN